MANSFTCACGQPLEAGNDQVGERSHCPACGQEAAVPDLAREADRPAGDSGQPPAIRPQRQPAGTEDDNDADNSADAPRGPIRGSGMANAALVLGLLTPLFGVFTSIPAIICGILGLRDIGRSQGRVRGTGLAIAGIVLSVLGMVLLGPVFVGVLIPAVLKVRDSANRVTSGNNLKQMGLAMHTYCSAMDRIPVHAAIHGKDGRPLLSWRVELLPYLGYDGLYLRFHLDEPWDSPHNLTLIPLMPRIFAHPLAAPSATAQGMTHYRAVTGPMSAFEPKDGLPPGIPQSIPDGPSNTIMLAEATDPVIWTRPDELAFEPGGPLPRLGLSPRRSFQVIMWDGSVRGVSPSVSRLTLESALMANDGVPLGPDW